MANVSLKNVYKYYGDSENPAVSDFNLEIKDKEFIVFVGPSGCGKSTTLRMVAGLEKISLGEITIDGKVANNVEPKDRDIAMVFQNYALYPHMSVYKNMAYSLTLAKTPVEERDESKIIARDKNGKRLSGLSLRFARTPMEQRDENLNIVYGEDGKPLYAAKKNRDGSVKKDKNGKVIYKMRPYTIDEYAGPVVTDENGKAKLVAKRNKDGSVMTDKNGETVYQTRKFTSSEIMEKVYVAARTLDIVQYLERKPSQLSGGQRQRVAIGRSIVRNPKVFLFDEPLSNLDAKLRNQMRAEIIALRHKINTTFIYVTHDQIEAMTLGDRIVIMRDGFMQQVGTPTELFDHPANLFVAGFIGTPQMNFFDGVLKVVDGRYVVDIDGKIFSLREEISDYLAAQKAAEKEVVLGVRPEHIVMDSEHTRNTLKLLENTGRSADYMEAEVTVAEMMGSELYVHANITDGKSAVVRVPTVSLTRSERANIDNLGKIRFTFAPETVHIFDKETSANLIPIDVDLHD